MTARLAIASLLVLSLAAGGCAQGYSSGAGTPSSPRVRCLDPPQRGAASGPSGDAPSTPPLVFLFCIQGP